MVRRCRSLVKVVVALALAASALCAAAASDCSAAELRRDELYVPAAVERLLPEKRTAYSDTYLLKDGNLKTVFYHDLVRFRDASGAWQPIDTKLEPRSVDDAAAGLLGLSGGVYQSTGTPMLVTVASEAAGQAPITVSYEGATVSFDLRSSEEATKLVSGSEALYLGARPETVLSYEVVAEGLKEEIRLASAEAPSSFTYFVSHDGLELRRDGTGQWGFYRPGEELPLFLLGEILTYDSSRNGAGDPAYADGASMEVAPAPGGSLVTYRVPRAWLTDPARVFPVVIDPSITLGQSVCTDTFIDSGSPGTAFGSDQELKTGYYSGAWKYSFIKFAVADLRDPDPAYVLDSHLRMYQHYSYSSPPKKTHVGIMDESWSGSSTWNSLSPGGIGMSDFGEVTDFPESWLDRACAVPTQEWVSQEVPNQGFCIWQDSGETTAYYRKFRSSEYGTSTQRPRLEVVYTQPTMTVSNTARVYRTGDLVHVRVTVDDLNVGELGGANLIQELRLGVNRAAGVSDD